MQRLPALVECLHRTEEGSIYKLFLKGWALLPQNYQEAMRKELFREGSLTVSLAMGSTARQMRVQPLSCVTWGKGTGFSEPYSLHL